MLSKKSLFVVLLATASSVANAQAAGAGADYNIRDREVTKEIDKHHKEEKRLDKEREEKKKEEQKKKLDAEFERLDKEREKTCDGSIKNSLKCQEVLAKMRGVTAHPAY